VQVDETKMSKSLGNFSTIRDIVKVFDPEVLRFFLVRAHYRSALNYSQAHLEDAKQGLTRLYTALKNIPSEKTEPDWSEAHAIRFKAAMDDDFNTAEAVAELFNLANEIGRGARHLGPQLRGLGAVLGLLERESQAFLQAGDGLSEDKIREMIAARLAARKAKNYSAADRIRKELEAAGVILEDDSLGSSWRRA
jgi:cysteinyl-tRNA synthetase